MSLEHLPPNIEQGIQRFADERHISHDEALVRLIQTGLTASKPTTVPKAADESAAHALAARRERSAERRARRESLAQTRPETPDALIGFLADAPEIAESIRQLAHERRRHAFGF
jgi:hypothetical protein